MANPLMLTTTGALPSPDRVVLDNLIRRELKVGDPSDPQQVAQALLERYRDDPRAQAIGQESRGLPFLQAAPARPVVQMLTAAGGAEWQQALSDIEQDLGHLSASALLKDVAPELRGWAQAIRSALTEGYNAARFALDPHNRDKGFAMRRQLNDYARLARLVGAHTPAMLSDYRKLAQSLDEAANLLIVIMGEALANVGFGGGRYVPQVPFTEMQQRRDAAVHALRNLVGTTQHAYGPEDWPRGLDAYRQLCKLLDAQGQSDLRSLLVETELARAMDELVQRGGDNTADGLRAVGSTALLGLERFRRFIVVARRGVSPESPALYAFLEALSLFASGFDSAGGYRLMKIARPPILFYGLYGSSGLDAADQRLVDLVSRRNLIADEIDCVAGACCKSERSCLVLLDKALYDIDRAIDLYALGFTDFGNTERRAAAYAWVIDQVAMLCCTSAGQVLPEMADLHEWLMGAARTLRPRLRLDDVGNKAVADTLERATQVARAVQDNQSHSTGNPTTTLADALAQLDQAVHRAEAAQQAGRATVEDLTTLYRAIGRVLGLKPALNHDLPDSEALDTFIELIKQELCMQLEMEGSWTHLVNSMVANCSQINQSLGTVQVVLKEALLAVSGEACNDGPAINLPPTLETSMDTLTTAIDRVGRGRPHPFLGLQKQRD